MQFIDPIHDNWSLDIAPDSNGVSFDARFGNVVETQPDYWRIDKGKICKRRRREKKKEVKKRIDFAMKKKLCLPTCNPCVNAIKFATYKKIKKNKRIVFNYKEKRTKTFTCNWTKILFSCICPAICFVRPFFYSHCKWIRKSNFFRTLRSVVKVLLWMTECMYLNMMNIKLINCILNSRVTHALNCSHLVQFVFKWQMEKARERERSQSRMRAITLHETDN